MSTAGISLLLILSPHRFRGLDIIGVCVFFLALLLFLTISTVLFCRFVYYRGTFTRAATRPREALFVSTFFLSIAALLTSMSAYGSHFLAERPENLRGLQSFLAVVFWIYLAVTFVYGILQYHMLFSVETRPALLRIDAMTPAWILPVFPVMLAGTLAAAFVPVETDPTRTAGMALAGLASQGLGMLISIFMFSTYLSRLMAHGLPHARPAMFMAVGPPSFTCAALLGLAKDAEHILAAMLQTMPHDAAIDGSPTNLLVLAQGLRLLALVSCAFLWGLSFWFLSMAVAGCACGMPDRKFHLSWWSLVFPNVGFVVSCIRMAEAVGSPGLSWFATVMMVVLVMAWLAIAAMCARAVYIREIVWPGHDEDAD
jgi:C4-dicarboxylate transporter/malic acid transport protein